MTQNNLGTALRGAWGAGERPARLDEAVAAHRDALEEATRERVPLDWATTRTTGPSANSSLGERRTARRTWRRSRPTARCSGGTSERVPLDWARAQNNLAQTQTRLAFALHDLERTDEAFALLEEMVSEPQEIDAFVQLGDLLRQDGKSGSSEKAYSRAIARLAELQREHWRLFYARGITYERTDRWPQAEADFLRALDSSRSSRLSLTIWVSAGPTWA